MADGDTVITIKLKLDEGDAESSAATAGKDAGEAFRKAFEEAAKDLDVSKSLKSDDLKKTFSQIGDEGKKTAKDLQDAFAKVQMPAAPRAPAVPAVHVPPRPRMPEDDRFERRLEAANTIMESMGKFIEGASPLTLLAPYLSTLGRRLMEGPDERAAREEATYFRRQGRAGFGGGVAGLAGMASDIQAFGGGGGGETAAAVGARVGVRVAEAAGAGGAAAALAREGGGARAVAAAPAVAAERAAAPAAAEGAEAAGGAGILGRMLLGPVGMTLATIGGIAFAVDELQKGVRKLALETAEADIRTEHMAKTMGMTGKELLSLRAVASESGVDIDDFTRGMYRLSVETQRRMPEIERQIEDSDRQIVESNIKVRESDRGVEKARLDREDATDAMIKTEAQYSLQLETGAEKRAIELRGAQLGVSGAQIGLRGAQMQQRAAGIQLQFAPQEQALQNIEGPLTVENAEMGLRGATLGSWAAGLRARQARGEAISPDEQQQLQLAQVSHASSAARLQKKNAEETLRRARLGEDERVTTETAGLGPVGQAQQRKLAADQAASSAALNLREQQLRLKTVDAMQTAVTQLMEDQAAGRKLERAKIGYTQSIDDVTKAENARARERIHVEQEVPYQNLGNVLSMLETGKPVSPGMMPPGGWKWGQVPPSVMRDALIARGRTFGPAGTAGTEGEPSGAGALFALAQLLQRMPREAALGAPGESAVQALFGGMRTLGGGPGGAAELSKMLVGLKTEGGPAGLFKQLPKEMQDRVTAAYDRLTRDVAEGPGGAHSRAERAIGTEQRTQEMMAEGGKVLGQALEPAAEKMAEAAGKFVSGAEGFAAKIIEKTGLGGAHFNPDGSLQVSITNWPDAMKTTTPPGAPGATHGFVEPHKYEGGPGQPLPLPEFDKTDPLAPLRDYIKSIPGAPGSDKHGAADAPQGAVTVAGGNINVTGTVAVSNMPAAAPAAAPESAKSGDVTATELARGGLIRGPGSGTSDSIPILASNGEYIIRQSRVAQLGVPFLDALNNRRMRFNLGGLVSLQHGGKVDSPSSLQSYDEASVQRALYKAWTDAHGTTPDPDSWAQVMRAKLNPETALDRFGNITEEGKRQAEQKRQGLAASLPPELTDQSFWARLARTGRTDISPGDPKSALAVASPGYMNELRRQMGLPPLLLPGMTADPQAQNAAAEAQRAQLMKVEQSIADQLRTDVWSRLAMTGSTMISPGDPRSAGIVASPKFMQQLRDSLGIKIPVDQDMSVDAQLARTGVAWGGTTHSIKIVASPLYQNILRERFGLPRLSTPGARPPQAPTVPPPGAPPGTAVPLTHRPPSGAPFTPGVPSGAPSTTRVPSGTPPTMQGKPGVPVISDDYLDHLQKNPGHIPQGPWQLYDSTAQTYVDMQPGKLLPVEPPAQTMWTIPTGPNGMFLTHDGVPAYRPPNNGMSLDYLETDKGKVFIPQGPWKIWDATRNTFIDMKPGLLQPVDPRAVMTPAPTPVPAVPVPGVTKPVAPPPRPDPNQPVLPTIKPEPPPPEPSQPAQPPTVTTPLPRPRPAEAPPPVPAISKPAEAPPPILPETVLPPRPAEPTRSTEDILKDLRENVIPSMIPTPKPAPGRLGRPEEQEIPKDLPPSDLLEAPSRHGEAERKVREASINGGDDEGAWRGGLIRLSGGGLVPAMVSNGEYRMSPEAVSHYGVSLFDRINGGGFAGGGTITMGRAQPPRPAGFPSGFSPIPEPGLIGEIANAMRNIGSVDPGVIRTMTGLASGAGEVASTHRLDLVTSAGTFTVQAGAETLAAIQSSAIGGKLTSTGARPSWY
jgi:hypothetical protein